MTRKILNITDVVSLTCLPFVVSCSNNDILNKRAKSHNLHPVSFLSVDLGWFILNVMYAIPSSGCSVSRHRLWLVWAASSECKYLMLCRGFTWQGIRQCSKLFFKPTLCLWQLLKSEEDASYKPAKKACVQLVDNLVEHILKYEESLAGMQIYHVTSTFLIVFSTAVCTACWVNQSSLVWWN